MNRLLELALERKARDREALKRASIHERLASLDRMRVHGEELRSLRLKVRARLAERRAEADDAS